MNDTLKILPLPPQLKVHYLFYLCLRSVRAPLLLIIKVLIRYTHAGSVHVCISVSSQYIVMHAPHEVFNPGHNLGHGQIRQIEEL
jgi:hypothetical protein